MATIKRSPMALIEKIVSGGQTGADRAALDFAIEHDILHSGWCPAGRKAEDGPIDSRYQLEETPSADYSERTERNVRDSDGTVIFTVCDQLKGGSKKTAQFSRRLGKPWLHLAANRPGLDHAAVLACFVTQHEIKVLNVAGPRASREQKVGKFVFETLKAALAPQASTQRKLRALVVDDEDWMRELYRMVMPSFCIFEAGTSEEGLKLAQQHRLDLVITDYSRPGKLDGLQFIAAFKRTHPNVPIIMASGRDIPLKRRALRLGAHVFLAKPFKREAFLAAVDHALSNPVHSSPT